MVYNLSDSMGNIVNQAWAGKHKNPCNRLFIGAHKMLNIHFRDKHVSKSLFCIKLSIKRAPVEVS